MHVTGVAGAHVPVPLHFWPGVKVVPEHIALAPHAIAAPG